MNGFSLLVFSAYVGIFCTPPLFKGFRRFLCFFIGLECWNVQTYEHAKFQECRKFHQKLIIDRDQNSTLTKVAQFGSLIEENHQL